MVQPLSPKHQNCQSPPAANKSTNSATTDQSQIILNRLLAKMAEWHPLPSLPPEATFSPTWVRYMDEAEHRAKTMEKAQLPSMDHLTYRDFEFVYEPGADTFLMLDAISHDLPLQRHSDIRQVLEIGCGSGLGVVYLATQIQHLQNQGPLHSHHQPQHQFIAMVTDVNPRALRVARKTAKQNGVKGLEAIQCDLASALLPRCAHSMDVILFNPPYVPTPDEEVGGTGIEASWAGGARGRRVVDRALPQIAQLLRPPHGVAYLVTVDDNDPEQMAETLLNQHGLVMRPVVRRKAHNECLTVHRLTWNHKNNHTNQLRENRLVI